MTHTLIISELDDFEAEHVAQILSDYRAKILTSKIEAITAKEDDRVVAWLDNHLAWHDEVMQKIRWTKNTG